MVRLCFRPLVLEGLSALQLAPSLPPRPFACGSDEGCLLDRQAACLSAWLWDFLNRPQDIVALFAELSSRAIVRSPACPFAPTPPLRMRIR